MQTRTMTLASNIPSELVATTLTILTKQTFAPENLVYHFAVNAAEYICEQVLFVYVLQ